MSTFVLLTITGLGLGAMYFLIASGLSLIYGLMGVLNFAHGVFLTVGAYTLWFTESKLGDVPVLPRFLIAALVGLVVGTVFAALVELVLIRPLYGRHIEQVLVTVGLALAVTALVTAIWGNDARVVAALLGRQHDDDPRGAHTERPLDRDRHARWSFSLALKTFLRRTRYGLIVRAGVENRAMVTALGIDVRTCVHARLRDRRSRCRHRRRAVRRSTSTTRRPAARDVARDLRVHRRGDRRSRLASRHGLALLRWSGSSSSTRTTTPRRGSATSASSCCSASCCSSGRRGLSGSFA